MTQYYVFTLGDEIRKLDEAPQASEWNDETYFMKYENGDLYEMEEDGEWRLIG